MSINNKQLRDGVALFGTPLFLYNSSDIASSYGSLSAALGDHTEIFYSIKANPNLSIVSYLHHLGARAEVCSLAELESVIELGILPKNIIFVGPAKSEEEIKLSLVVGIYAIVCESLAELQRIADCAKQLGVIANVAFRINPDFTAETAPLKMGGRPSQFGLEVTALPEAVAIVHKTKELHFRGLHIYNGTRILDGEDLVNNTQKIIELAEYLEEKYELALEMLDMGGGFGVPYFDKETELNLVTLAKSIQPLLNKFKRSHPDTRLIFESGRYLVASAGYFISKVVDIKSSHGEVFVLVDGGTNCHMAAVGTGAFLKRNYPISIVHQYQDQREVRRYNIVGPLCTPGDLLGKNVELSEPNLGDLLVIKQSGAYGPTASPVNFLSHGFPAEVLFHNDKFFLIRERDFPKDIRSKQRLIQNFNLTKEKLNATV